MSLAKAEHAELEICSVVDPIVVCGTMPPSPGLDLLRDLEIQARRLVTTAVQGAHVAGIEASGETIMGAPFDKILEVANQVKADAIVMGTHGRTGLRRLFLGSVAESVLRAAPCPVIVVREKARLTSASSEVSAEPVGG